MKVYVFAIGNIDPINHRKAAKRAVEFITRLPGFKAVHPHNPDGTLLCFDTLDNAIRSRARYTETGNVAGRYIMEGTVDADKGLLTIEKVAYDSQGVS